MKNLIAGVAMLVFLYIGHLIDFYAKTKWVGAFVANKTFSGVSGVITMYVMEAIPTIVVFTFFGAAFYQIAKRTTQATYWLFGYALLATLLKMFSTKWHFSEQVAWVRSMFEYSKVIMPMVFIYTGGSIAKRVERPPNKSL